MCLGMRGSEGPPRNGTVTIRRACCHDIIHFGGRFPIVPARQLEKLSHKETEGVRQACGRTGNGATAGLSNYVTFRVLNSLQSTSPPFISAEPHSRSSGKVEQVL